MQPKSEIENWYKQPDPWGYESNESDKNRKQRILEILSVYSTFDRAIDIGCGEGFITQDLPANEIHGIELSDNAAERLPKNVKRVHKPEGKYDLILCTGMLYRQYDYRKFLDWINEHARGIVLTSNIKSWQINDLPDKYLLYQEDFPYREYTQNLRVYRWE